MYKIYVQYEFTTMYDMGYPGLVILGTRYSDMNARCTPRIKGIKIAASSTIYEQPNFLQRLHMDMCGPMSPECGSLRYLKVASGTCETKFFKGLSNNTSIETAFPVVYAGTGTRYRSHLFYL